MKVPALAFLLITLVATLAAVVGVVVEVQAHGPIKHDHLDIRNNLPALRQKFCGNDKDCVTVKEHGTAGIIRITDLDLLVDTPDTLVEKLPGWFGPRPAKFVHEHDILHDEAPLATQGVEVAGTIVIYPMNEHQKRHHEHRMRKKRGEVVTEEELHEGYSEEEMQERVPIHHDF